MNYSRNIKVHGILLILGAFLEPIDNDTNDITHYSTHDETLQQAATWLARNNSYLQPYASIL